MDQAVERGGHLTRAALPRPLNCWSRRHLFSSPRSASSAASRVVSFRASPAMRSDSLEAPTASLWSAKSARDAVTAPPEKTIATQSVICRRHLEPVNEGPVPDEARQMGVQEGHAMVHGVSDVSKARAWQSRSARPRVKASAQLPAGRVSTPLRRSSSSISRFASAERRSLASTLTGGSDRMTTSKTSFSFAASSRSAARCALAAFRKSTSAF